MSTAWVDSASNRNEYDEHFLRVKLPVRKADKLTTIPAVVMNFGNLKFVELSGYLQACNWKALLLHLV